MQNHWHHFATQCANNNLPHALLFSGPACIGKLKFSQSLAQLFLCSEIKKVTTAVNSQPCGNCRSCQLFAANSHPDYWLVAPEEKSKVITVEQIRDLSHALMHTAQLNRYQVAIIAPAHAMNAAAANALLKTLEEPPGPVIIILISDKIHVLPRTIYSRCQVINLKQALTEQTHNNHNALYATLSSEFLMAQNNRKKYDPINLAKFCTDFKIEEVLDCLFTIVTDFIKTASIATQLNVAEKHNLLQHYFHFYDRLLEAKKLQDHNINFNVQAMLENLLIAWRVGNC